MAHGGPLPETSRVCRLEVLGTLTGYPAGQLAGNRLDPRYLTNNEGAGEAGVTRRPLAAGSRRDAVAREALVALRSLQAIHERLRRRAPDARPGRISRATVRPPRTRPPLSQCANGGSATRPPDGCHGDARRIRRVPAFQPRRQNDRMADRASARLVSASGRR
jgi:hypothetical protein